MAKDLTSGLMITNITPTFFHTVEKAKKYTSKDRHLRLAWPAQCERRNREREREREKQKNQ